MRGKIRLVDVRQIGPHRERAIVGRCSRCGSYLLASLDKSEPASAEMLRSRLQSVFEQHLSDDHSEISPENERAG